MQLCSTVIFYESLCNSRTVSAQTIRRTKIRRNDSLQKKRLSKDNSSIRQSVLRRMFFRRIIFRQIIFRQTHCSTKSFSTFDELSIRPSVDRPTAPNSQSKISRTAMHLDCCVTDQIISFCSLMSTAQDAQNLPLR